MPIADQVQILVGVLSLLVSLLAVVYTVREARLNSSAAVRFLEAMFSYSDSIRYGKRHLLAFTLRNRGISLHDISLFLIFREEDGYGTLQIPIGKPKPGEFARGMTGKFEVVIESCNKGEQTMLGALRDPFKQKAMLLVCAQGFEVQRIRVGSFSDNFKTWVDETLCHPYVSVLRAHHRFPKGRPIYDAVLWLLRPNFILLGRPLTQAAECARIASRRPTLRAAG